MTERRWLLWATVLLLTLTLLPLAVAAAATPSGHIFGGFVEEARDGVAYVAKATEGLQGHWLYHDPYTSEPHPGSLTYLPYLLLGQAARVLPLSVPQLIHLARVALDAGLVITIYRLAEVCFPDVGRRRLAFLLALLGGGIGALTGSHARILGYNYVSLDVGVSGAVGVDSLNLAPHIVLACLGSAWLALVWSRHQVQPSARRLLGGLIGSLAISAAYPQLATMWALTMVVAWALRPRRSTLLMALAVAAGALPYAVYGLYLRAANPIFAGWPPSGDVDVGDPLSYLLWAHLLMLPFAIAAAVTVLRSMRLQSQSVPLDPLVLMVIWILASTVLMYVPGLPSILHRLYYGSFIPFGFLAGAGLYRWAQTVRAPSWRRRALVYPAALMSIAALQSLGQGLAIPLLHRDDLALYFPKNEASVLAQLRSLHPEGGQLVMNSYLSGLWVPALSGQTTYIGFPFETLDLATKNRRVSSFYGTTDPDQVRLAAAKLHLDYVLWGRYEAGLGGSDPGALAGWPLVARQGEARLYWVPRAGS